MEFRIYEIYDPTCRAAKEIQVNNIFLDSLGEGEGGMI